jgi:hypothetical protein
VTTLDDCSFYLGYSINGQNFDWKKGVLQRKKPGQHGIIVENWYYPMVTTKPM